MKAFEAGNLDVLSGPWPIRNHVYRYMEPKYARPYSEGGSIRVARAASYVGKETRGIFTPDEVKHRVGHGFPAGVGAETFATGYEAVVVENAAVRTSNISFAAEYNWTVNHMVLCLSNSASHRVRIVLNKPPDAVVFRIIQPDVLIEAISERLGCNPIYGEVKYTDAPDRGAFTKGLDSAEQREVRFAWDYNGPEDELYVAIPAGVGEIVNLHNLDELLDPLIIRTGGISLLDYVMRGDGMARISAMMAGDEEWLAQLKGSRTQ